MISSRKLRIIAPATLTKVSPTTTLMTIPPTILRTTPATRQATGQTAGSGGRTATPRTILRTTPATRQATGQTTGSGGRTATPRTILRTTRQRGAGKMGEVEMRPGNSEMAGGITARAGPVASVEGNMERGKEGTGLFDAILP